MSQDGFVQGVIIDQTTNDSSDGARLSSIKRLNPLYTVWKVLRSLICLWNGEHLLHLQNYVQEWMYTTQLPNFRLLLEEFLEILQSLQEMMNPCSTRVEVPSAIGRRIVYLIVPLDLTEGQCHGRIKDLLLNITRRTLSATLIVTILHTQASNIFTSSTIAALPMDSVDAPGLPNPSSVSSQQTSFDQPEQH